MDASKMQDTNKMLNATWKDLKEKTDSLGFLTITGSRLHGTETDQSDWDIRGVYIESTEDLVMGKKKVIEMKDDNRDVVVYDLRTFFQMAYNGDISLVEMLFAGDDYKLFPWAKINMYGLIEELRPLVLSYDVIDSIWRYYHKTKIRLQKKASETPHDCKIKLMAEIDSMKRSQAALEGKIQDHANSDVKIYMHEEQIVTDISLQAYPVKDLRAIVNDMAAILRIYNKIQFKKIDTPIHMAKEMSHAIRLLATGIELIEKNDICLDPSIVQELKDIKQGKYLQPDGTINPAYFNETEKWEERLEQAMKKSSLRQTTDRKMIRELEKKTILHAVYFGLDDSYD